MDVSAITIHRLVIAARSNALYYKDKNNKSTFLEINKIFLVFMRLVLIYVENEWVIMFLSPFEINNHSKSFCGEELEIPMLVLHKYVK